MYGESNCQTAIQHSICFLRTLEIPLYYKILGACISFFEWKWFFNGHHTTTGLPWRIYCSLPTGRFKQNGVFFWARVRLWRQGCGISGYEQFFRCCGWRDLGEFFVGEFCFWRLHGHVLKYWKIILIFS